MKAFLLFPDRDFDPGGELPANEPALIQDLGLGTLFAAMGGGDTFLTEVARRVALSSLTAPDAITYRQRILHDCLQQADVVRQIYDLAAEAVYEEKQIWRATFSRYPAAILRQELEALGLFVGILKRLRCIADEHARDFRSEGFVALFDMLTRELDDDYFRVVEEYLRMLRFDKGVLISAELGKGNKGTNYILRRPHASGSWLRRLTVRDRSTYTWRLPDRDEAGAQALGELRGKGLNLAANALAQSTDHILSFVTMLRSELGFYIGLPELARAALRAGRAGVPSRPAGRGPACAVLPRSLRRRPEPAPSDPRRG